MTYIYKSATYFCAAVLIQLWKFFLLEESFFSECAVTHTHVHTTTINTEMTHTDIQAHNTYKIISGEMMIIDNALLKTKIKQMVEFCRREIESGEIIVYGWLR